MAKELPYFKFYISEWVNGDITLEDYELQGLFINICAYYWSKDGDLSNQVLLKRFRGYDEQIKQLITSGIIKSKDGSISISFLNEQLQSKQLQKYTNKINGSKGGRPKAVKTEDKPNGLFFGTEHETESKASDNPNETNIDYSKEDYSKEDNILDDVLNEIESKTVGDILKFFGYDTIHNKKQQSLSLAFVYSLKFKGKYDFFVEQFKAYSDLKSLDKYPHKIENFLGTQSQKFEDGKWDDNWKAHLDSYKIKNDIPVLSPNSKPKETTLQKHKRRLAEQNGTAE